MRLVQTFQHQHWLSKHYWFNEISLTSYAFALECASNRSKLEEVWINSGSTFCRSLSSAGGENMGEAFSPKPSSILSKKLRLNSPRSFYSPMWTGLPKSSVRDFNTWVGSTYLYIKLVIQILLSIGHYHLCKEFGQIIQKQFSLMASLHGHFIIWRRWVILYKWLWWQRLAVGLENFCSKAWNVEVGLNQRIEVTR